MLSITLEVKVKVIVKVTVKVKMRDKAYRQSTKFTEQRLNIYLRKLCLTNQHATPPLVSTYIVALAAYRLQNPSSRTAQEDLIVAHSSGSCHFVQLSLSPIRQHDEA